MSQSTVVLCAAVRTPVGTYNGALKDVPAPHLGAVAIGESLSRAKIDRSAIDTVVMGQVVQAGAKMNPARQAAVEAGLPVAVPAMTVNRVCGSGAQAIATAAQEQARGRHEVNTAVNQMDQMTQQNAAMVEQTTAAAHSLKGEAARLGDLVKRFELDTPGAAAKAA